MVGSDNKTEWTATGQVASDAPGMANYSISVRDLTGNEATPVTSTTSINLDTDPPFLSEINLVSNNANDPDVFAKPGDNLTLSFNSSETLLTPVIIMADIASLNVMDTSIYQDGTSWSAVHFVSSGDTNDNLTFSILYLIHI